MKTKVFINLVNDTKEKIRQKSLVAFAEKILAKKQIFGIFEIDLSFVSSDKIKKINSQYLGKKFTTNVLSFPIYSKNRLISHAKKMVKTRLLLGQIIIAYDVAKKEAQETKVSINKYIEFLFLHGLKHLLGYHHK